MTDHKTKDSIKDNSIAKISNRELKSDVFTALFSEPENAAKLYSALSGAKTAPEAVKKY